MIVRPLSRPLRLGLVLALAGLGGAVLAQNQIDGVSTPSMGSGGSFEVSSVQVDVVGKTADAARQGGWRLAQRKGWSMLAQRLTGKPSTLSDSALDAIVTGIVVENEQIGPTRYIARLGVLFDRGRAASILGVADRFRRSAPMLVIPVISTGGVARVFERETPWQKAWGRFRTGNSAIDYVRVAGTGPDKLLLNAGQVGRNGRGWWREILDQYGASDILIPEVRLRREWPGGPIVGTFIANHGPDNVRLAQFTLRASSPDALDALLDEGAKRIDQAYQDALNSGALKTDRLLSWRAPKPVAATEEENALGNETSIVNDAAPITTTSQSYSIQVETPSAAAVTGAESALRGVPGIRSATTTSLAIGGISVVRVTFDGDVAALGNALQARGWQVQEGGGTLRIRRGGGGQPAQQRSAEDNTQE